MKKDKQKYQNPHTKTLEPFGAVIQRCPNCGKLDAYKNDSHSCTNPMERQQYMDWLYK